MAFIFGAFLTIALVTLAKITDSFAVGGCAMVVGIVTFALGAVDV